MYAAIATLACGVFFGAVLYGAGVPWLLGAVLLFAVVPVTLVSIKPVNDRLLAPAIALPRISSAIPSA